MAEQATAAPEELSHGKLSNGAVLFQSISQIAPAAASPRSRSSARSSRAAR